jgi:hypothetical protein
MPKKVRNATEREARTMTGIRLDPDAIARLDAIAAADEGCTGFRPTRSDVLRGCLYLGIAQREQEIRGKK